MSRSRDTSNTFIEQDQLGRAYSGTNDLSAKKTGWQTCGLLISTHRGSRISGGKTVRTKTVSKVKRNHLLNNTLLQEKELKWLPVMYKTSHMGTK